MVSKGLSLDRFKSNLEMGLAGILHSFNGGLKELCVIPRNI